MKASPINPAELILTESGRIYHLDLAPEDIASTIFLVGDPQRVPVVSQFFDDIELTRHHREFITHTGHLGNKRVTVMSTGMSTANIEIALTELDALVNIDLATRTPKAELTSLNLIRLGTAGGLQADLPINSFVASEYALALDNLLHYYAKPCSKEETALAEAFTEQSGCSQYLINPIATTADPNLLKHLSPGCQTGITATSPGFYAPQGRRLRAKPVIPNWLENLTGFRSAQGRLLNFEMETAAIYGFGQLFGHRCLSLSAIIANRVTGEFSARANETVVALIQQTLNEVKNNCFFDNPRTKGEFQQATHKKVLEEA